MINFNECKNDVILQLQRMQYEGGIDDIGNEIGIVIAKYFKEEDDSYVFLGGIEHGISLTDGTHDLEEPEQHIKKNKNKLKKTKKASKLANKIIKKNIENYDLLSDRVKLDLLSIVFKNPPKRRKYKI